MQVEMQNNTERKTLVTHLDEFTANHVNRAKEFFRYYNAKRARHQHRQVSMLEKPAYEGKKNLTEIGSLFGYATGLFQAAGFAVTTIDVKPDMLGELRSRHINKDILQIDESDLAGTEIIVCCETLEHIKWEQAVDRIALFHKSGASYLLISVPYRSPHIILNLELARYASTFKLYVKRFWSRFTTFKIEPEEWGHKWEVGYKHYPLSRLEQAMSDNGWAIIDRKHEVPSGSIFLLCKPK